MAARDDVADFSTVPVRCLQIGLEITDAQTVRLFTKGGCIPGLLEQTYEVMYSENLCY